MKKEYETPSMEVFVFETPDAVMTCPPDTGTGGGGCECDLDIDVCIPECPFNFSGL